MNRFFCLITHVLLTVLLTVTAHARDPHYESNVVDGEEYFAGAPGRSAKKRVPSTKFADFNTGWKESFKNLASRLSPDRDYVTWIIAEPKVVMDLRSAEHFRTSFMIDALENKSISHMMVAWSCHDTDGKLLRGGTGLSGEDGNQTQDMLLKGWGMTPLYAVFTDGILNRPEEIGMMMSFTSHTNIKIAHVTFEVPRTKCQNMLRFFKAFLKHPSKPSTRFGLNLDPLKFEGGGCGSFAAALLSQAGVLETVQPHLWREMRSSQYLMGLGLDSLPKNVELRLPREYYGQTRFVWLGDLMQLPWTSNDGPILRLLDPEMSIFALRQLALEYARHSAPQSKKALAHLEKTGFAERVVKGAAPGPINERFDEQAARVAYLARKELGFLQHSGMKATPVTLGSHWGLLIAR